MGNKYLEKLAGMPITEGNVPHVIRSMAERMVSMKKGIKELHKAFRANSRLQNSIIESGIPTATFENEQHKFWSSPDNLKKYLG